MIAAASVARPANVVARLVRDDMPGAGVQWVSKGAPLAASAPSYTSADDAITAARALSGDDAPAVGVFHAGGAFRLFGLDVAFPGTAAQPYDPALENDFVARTVAGRGLVAVVDGAAQADLMSAASFRNYERQAGGE